MQPINKQGISVYAHIYTFTFTAAPIITARRFAVHNRRTSILLRAIALITIIAPIILTTQLAAQASNTLNRAMNDHKMISLDHKGHGFHIEPFVLIRGGLR